MAILFQRKTNKRINNLYQVKTQIRHRAERLRRQELRDMTLVRHDANHDSRLFASYGDIHFIQSGRGEYHEHY